MISKYLKSCIILLIFSSIAYAEDFSDNVFLAKDVIIEAHEGNLIDSKTAAMGIAAKKGLLQLMMRLNVHNQSYSQQKLQQCIDRTVIFPLNLVAESHIKSERMTSESYEATMDIMFDSKQVQGMLNTCGFTHATVESDKTLIIPVLISNISENARIAWEETWQNAPKTVGLMHFENIRWDLGDISNINQSNIVYSNYDDLHLFLLKYNCRAAVIVMLTKIDETNFSVDFSIIGKNSEYHDIKQYKILKNEVIESFFSRILYDVTHEVDRIWKRGVEQKDKKVYNSSVIVKLNSNTDWQKIRNILNGMEEIKQYKYRAIEGNSIEVELEYITTPSNLSAQLLKKNIVISQDNDKILMEYSLMKH